MNEEDISENEWVLKNFADSNIASFGEYVTHIVLEHPDGTTQKLSAAAMCCSTAFFYNFQNCIEEIRNMKNHKIVKIKKVTNYFPYNTIYWLNEFSYLTEHYGDYYDFFKYNIKFDNGEIKPIFMCHFSNGWYSSWICLYENNSEKELEIEFNRRLLD